MKDVRSVRIAEKNQNLFLKIAWINFLVTLYKI